MRNKRCLSFLVITLILVMSMLSNVSAGYRDWTCTYSRNTIYSVGQVVDGVSGLDISSDNGHTGECMFESDFEVEPGDKLWLSFGAYFTGNESKFDGSASACGATVYAEDGTKLLEVRFELCGYLLSSCGNDVITIDDETAGKLKFNIFMEGTGTTGVGTDIEELYVEVNGSEV